MATESVKARLTAATPGRRIISFVAGIPVVLDETLAPGEWDLRPTPAPAHARTDLELALAVIEAAKARRAYEYEHSDEERPWMQTATWLLLNATVIDALEAWEAAE